MSDVVVVGAGVFGTWTAFHLHRAGAHVTLVDAYGAGNSRSSSGDESRIVRRGYGPDAIYSRMAERSLRLWREHVVPLAPTGSIWQPTGVLWLAGQNDPYTAATLDVLLREGCAVEVLEGRSLRARFPQLALDDLGAALLEPDGGVLLARRAVQALAQALEADGVRMVRGQVKPLVGTGRLDALRLADGRVVAGSRFVLACGAWLPNLCPDVLQDRIRPTRQVVVYFGVPPGDEGYGPARLPAWIDFPAGIYGVPEIEARGVKVGLDQHGPPIDPDTAHRVPDEASVETMRAWLARRMPGMAAAPVVEGRVCQYENTSSGDFLIDRHPGYENVWIVGGGSGHGFKHGPAVGEYAAQLVQIGAASTEPRFSLATKDTRARRAVC